MNPWPIADYDYDWEEGKREERRHWKNKRGKREGLPPLLQNKEIVFLLPLKKRDFLSHIFFEEYSISEEALLFFPQCCMISPPIYDNRICEDALSLPIYLTLPPPREKRRRKMHTRRPKKKKKRYLISAMGFAGLKGGWGCSLSLLSPFQATLFPFSPSSYSVHGSSGRRRYIIRQRLRNIRSRWIATWKDGWILVMPSFPFSQRGGGGRGRNKQKKEDSRGRGGRLALITQKGKRRRRRRKHKTRSLTGGSLLFSYTVSIFPLSFRSTGPLGQTWDFVPIYTLPER